MITPEMSDDGAREFMAATSEGETWTGQFTVHSRDGKAFRARVSTAPIYGMNGSRDGIVSVWYDLTDQQRVAEELIRSERRWRSLYEQAPVGILLADSEHRVVDANPAAAEMLGFTVDELRGMRADDLIHPDDADAVPLEVALPEPDATTRQYQERRYRTKHGGYRTSIQRIKKLEGLNEEVAYAVMFQDITERKQAEGELQRVSERHNQAERTARLGHWEMDIPTGQSVWSDEFFRICGYTPQIFAPTAELGFTLIHPDDRERAARHVTQAIETGTPYSIEKRIVRPDGEVRWVHSRGEIMYGEDQQPETLVGSFLDITERKHAEEQLEAALEEKDRLMREINHRVKNNLATVLSLLRLKQNAVGDEVDLSDIVSQVDSIRFIHEKLQQSEDMGRVDFGPYVAGVLASALPMRTGSSVEIENEIYDVSLPTKVATTLGLIVNELATNAAKHGFTADSERRFSVCMDEVMKDVSDGTCPDSRELVLTVSNTGPAFPDGIDLRQPKTLGLQLVTALTRQLGGTLELQRKPHPVFTIRFPAPD